MSAFQLYFDEDAMNSRLVGALRARGVIVITVIDVARTAVPDDEQLAFASEHGCVLFTYNVSDFYRLHTEWRHADRDHAGIILAA